MKTDVKKCLSKDDGNSSYDDSVFGEVLKYRYQVNWISAISLKLQKYVFTLIITN